MFPFERVTLVVVLALLAVWAPRAAVAQVGGNTCAEAGVITTDGSYPFNTTSATADDPCFVGGRTAWFRFTAPDDGRVNANTCESDYNTYLTVYRNDDCPTSCSGVVAQNDDWCGDQSDVSFIVKKDETYHFAINGPTVNDFGPGELFFEFIGVAVGDDCANAVELFENGEYPFSNIGVSADDPCRAVSPTYWFSFTAPYDGEVLANTCGFSPNYDTFLSAFGGNCPTSCTGRLTTNDDFCGIQSRIVFRVEKDKTYKIAASGYVASAGQSTLLFEYTPDEIPVTPGDINGDGLVNVADVTALARLVAAGTPPAADVGDMNDDGEVDELDVRALAELIVQ